MTDRIVTSMETATGDGLSPSTPWHLWAVGILAFLWNGYGALDYVMSQLRNEAWLSQTPGVEADAMIAYLDDMPAWLDAFWAVGVWGALLAAVLLLARSRYAVGAYIVSIVGMTGSLGLDLAGLVDKPDALQVPTLKIMAIVLFVVAFLQLFYASAMAKRGVLR